MIGLRSLVATIRMRRRVWLIAGLVGLMVGVILPVAIPHKYTAETDLYLATPAGTDSLQFMANNVSLLQTDVVAKEAITKGHLHVTPQSLLSHYSGLSVSGNIMSIKFSGPNQKDVVAGARAVADAFLAVQARELRLQTDSLVRGLRSQISSLNTEINGLNARISSLSDTAAATDSSGQLSDLVSQQGQAESQMSQLQTQLQQALLNEQSTVRASTVLDPAQLVVPSTKKAVLVDGMSGLIAGLAIGLTAVILGALLSQRPPDRSTVAATLGAPVELSLGRYRRPLLMRKVRLARQLRTPSSAQLMIERRLRGHLESAPGSALAVVAVGAPELAALAVGALAFGLSSEGHRVIVVDAANDRPLTSILGLSSTSETMETFELPPEKGPSVRVIVAPKDPMSMAKKPPPDDADVLLVLVTLDPGFGAEHLTRWVTDAVLVLSPRGVTLTRMEVSREMLREAGISLRSIILLDSDPQDDSYGVLSSGDVRLAPTAVESTELSE
jgi:capsular polysaccharide biosynthesis protein